MAERGRWTPEQATVIRRTDHGLLSASAGTGKTTTIVGKLLWILGLDVGETMDGVPIEPCARPCRLQEIAAVTFTEKAAAELKEKLRQGIEASAQAGELRWDLDSASVGTIHAFCARLLRDNALRLGIDPSFRVLDELEASLHRQEVIRAVVLSAIRAGGEDMAMLVEQFPLYDGRHTKGMIAAADTVLRELRWHASRYAGWTRPDPGGSGLELDLEQISSRFNGDAGAASTDPGPALRAAGALYRLAREAEAEWRAWMEDENVRDFDSLILDARRLLTRPEHRAALESIRRDLKILVIDEFQDTDSVQRDIAFALAGVGDGDSGPAPQLLLVGDPKQSIYRFRGADVGVWNEARAALCRDDPPMELSVNFRTRAGVVDFINTVCGAAIDETSVDLSRTSPELGIPYSPLTAVRPAGPGEGIDWLDCSAGPSPADRRTLEARLVVSRVRALLTSGRISDPGTGAERAVKPRDIAVLSRKRKGLDLIERALRDSGIRTFNGASQGLAERQEIIDLVTVLRLFRNPADDYHGFGFLRSPLVGLRDETIVRFRLDPGSAAGPLLSQAASFLQRCEAGETEWFEAPESPHIGAVERESLRRALESLRHGQDLVDRVPAAELLEHVLRRTDFRLHLLMRPAGSESVASIERFKAMLDEYRYLPLAGFLELWDRWGEQDLGVPQAAMFSAGDDVVTLQTIHTAKGLEWPIVFLIRATDADSDRLSRTYLADPELGPILMPSKAGRDDRAVAIADREAAAEQAEEARLQYVALTRARDRLVIAGPEGDTGYMRFIGPALEGASLPHLAREEQESANGRRVPAKARSADPVTGTGGQIEVFDGEGSGQLDIFVHSPRAADPGALRPESAVRLVAVVYRDPDPVQGQLAEAVVSLEWLDGIEARELPVLARPVADPARSRLSSATERTLRLRDPKAWRLRYIHGLEEAWRFAPAEDPGSRVPALFRGTLIHGVLERIRSADELAVVLNETIAGIDAPPGVEDQLRPGTAYREALEAEIAAVVAGPEWRWYVESEHYRELDFLHLAGPDDWRLGAIDLFRSHGSGTEQPVVVDFKTHVIEASAVPDVAQDYITQLEVYREAIADLTGREPRTVLHFTHPNRVYEPD